MGHDMGVYRGGMLGAEGGRAGGGESLSSYITEVGITWSWSMGFISESI
jgi:hypothetical protein